MTWGQQDRAGGMAQNPSKVVVPLRPETAGARIVRESHAATPPPVQKTKPKTVRFEITLVDVGQAARDLTAVGVAIGKAVKLLGACVVSRQSHDPDYSAAALAAVREILARAAQKANAYRRDLVQTHNVAQNQWDDPDLTMPEETRAHR